jgi:ribA/ribD-fused uncharacterized protein
MITQFKGKFDFLDPAYYCLAKYDGELYNSAEAAFLSAQFDSAYFRSMFRNPVLPIWRARELAKKLQQRHDWTPALSIEIMRQITLDKFSCTPKLRAALLATRNERIVAENNWHEQFWGCCICAARPGKYGQRSSCSELGRNHLGDVLMSVRQQLGVLARAG